MLYSDGTVLTRLTAEAVSRALRELGNRAGVTSNSDWAKLTGGSVSAATLGRMMPPPESEKRPESLTRENIDAALAAIECDVGHLADQMGSGKSRRPVRPDGRELLEVETRMLEASAGVQGSAAALASAIADWKRAQEKTIEETVIEVLEACVFPRFGDGESKQVAEECLRYIRSDAFGKKGGSHVGEGTGS